MGLLPVRQGGHVDVVDVPEPEPEPEPVLVGRGTQLWVPELVPVVVAVPLANGLTLLPPLAEVKSQSQLP